MGLTTKNLAPKATDFYGKGALDPREHYGRVKGLITPEVDNSVSDEAAKAEAERRAQAEATTGRINSVFDSPARKGQYNDFITALRERFGSNLQRQKGDTDRQDRFTIARRGLTGGSRSVDLGQRRGEQYAEGVLGAEEKAQGALSDLRSRDNASRSTLIGLATNGLDATTAAQRAISQLQQNSGISRNKAINEGIGDTFGTFADAYGRQQQQDAYRRGRASPYGG